MAARIHVETALVLRVVVDQNVRWWDSLCVSSRAEYHAEA